MKTNPKTKTRPQPAVGQPGGRFDVAIIGGGVVGCAIARALSRFRLKTVLLERNEEVAFGATKTNSGIVHAGHNAPANTVKGPLEVRGNKLFDELHKDLHFGFRRCGELVVAMEEAQIPDLEKLKRQGEEKGVAGLEMWAPERIQREEPNLSTKIVMALLAPTAGVINPYEFAFALIENAMANGVELRVNCPVAGIEQAAQGLRLKTPQGVFETRFALNCAGVFADEIAHMLGMKDFRIIPRKGEEYMLDKRLQGLVRRLIFPLPTKTSKGILVIPTFDGTIMVGPTAETTEDRYDWDTTPFGAEKVFSFVRQLCPSITERDTITEFAGLRPASDTDDFIIGPTRVKGFINVAGIQSPGLTAAPAIAERVCDILRDEGLSFEEKDDFEAHTPGTPHFAALSPEEQEFLIKQDPRYGRVVCRCELVTEAEVHGAVDHGARTLDGIKFRTRAGMGRCQGGFCTTRCMDILSKRLDKPFHEITKRGGGSWISVPMEAPVPAKPEGVR
ncbi:MAG: NAD(P)/FAD-dependent oxidoreductase [Elusimicrobiota bacterium]